jgi:hypothetical protein
MEVLAYRTHIDYGRQSQEMCISCPAEFSLENPAIVCSFLRWPMQPVQFVVHFTSKQSTSNERRDFILESTMTSDKMTY